MSVGSGDISEAVAGFLALDMHIWEGVGPSLTCAEAETFADLYRCVGRDDLAFRMIAMHAEGDEEGDEHHHLRGIPTEGPVES